MSYSDFTIELLKEKFGVRFIENKELFTNMPTHPAPSLLTQLLQRYVPLATMINTEKARSEFIIAPLLGELKFYTDNKISLFSGTEFVVDQQQGLNGRCDYIICKSEEQLVLNAPIIVVVEAKNENLIGVIPQCIAEMIAAMRFNTMKDQPIEAVYGIVTTGSLWRFLKLEQNNIVFVDMIEYHIQNVDTIWGIVHGIVA